ncbi:hypothetical protein [Corynebacterium silvaticum]|uniref:hypothetical protein n=1 Tax=Corynebacterium silvaticum TaxID=2320431 RepID=UPI001067921F|nr:hypothetical protein [Corynebacterium silvaticum]
MASWISTRFHRCRSTAVGSDLIGIYEHDDDCSVLERGAERLPNIRRLCIVSSTSVVHLIGDIAIL